MRTHLALVRGINVGGRNKVAMAELRHMVSALGHADVTTYVQSGNVLFRAADPEAASAAVAEELAAALAQRLSVHAAVVVLTRQELDEVVKATPFPDEANPKALHAVFLPEAPDGPGVAAVAAAVERARAAGSADDAAITGRVVYLRTPGGYGRSRLVVELARSGARSTPVAEGTARNWATVTALAGLFAE